MFEFDANLIVLKHLFCQGQLDIYELVLPLDSGRLCVLPPLLYPLTVGSLVLGTVAFALLG